MRPVGYSLGLLLVTASATAWSTAGLFTRLIPLDRWTMLAWHGIFGALGLGLVILTMERRNILKGFCNLGWPGWFFAALGGLGMIFFITSLRHTTVAHEAVIYATVPFLAAGLGWLVSREKPSTSAITASLAALAGVMVMVGFGTEGSLLGDLLAFGMTIAMALIMVIARSFRHIPVMPAACLSALLSGLVCWPLGDPLVASGQEFLMLALFGLVNSAVGLSLFPWARDCCRPSKPP
jgi:drug/metabolite transporter (DMT)-like permease